MACVDEQFQLLAVVVIHTTIKQSNHLVQVLQIDAQDSHPVRFRCVWVGDEGQSLIAQYIIHELINEVADFCLG